MFLLQIVNILLYSFFSIQYQQIIPRHYELKYQQVFIDTLQQQYSIEKDGNQQSQIVPETDERVLLIKKIVSELQEACIYFSPECEEYMSHMKVIVINDDEINAYSTLGLFFT